MLYPINEFLVDSEAPLSGTGFAGTIRPCWELRPTIRLRCASLADIPCTLRKVRRQLVYDVGDGFLLEPTEGIALHVDMRGKAFTLDCADDLLPTALSWAFHAGLGAATLAHGGLPLHSSGIEVDGRYVGLMADSGAGKSTLSWHLLQNGFRFGNDDLIPVRLGANGVIAYPSLSLYPRLRGGTVGSLGLDTAELLPLDLGAEEPSYYARLGQEQRVVEEQRLVMIFVLQPEIADCGGAFACDCDRTECRCRAGSDLAPDEVVPHRLSAEDAAQTIQSNLHAVWLIGKWLDQRQLAILCAEVAARVPVVELRYIRSYEILPRLGEVIRDLTARMPTPAPITAP